MLQRTQYMTPNQTSMGNFKNQLPDIQQIQQEYIRKRLRKTCCKDIEIPEDCQKQVKSIFQVLLKHERAAEYISLIALFKLLRESSLVLSFGLLTKMIAKANQCAGLKQTENLNVNSFHQFMHALDVQTLYRKILKYMPQLPSTVEQLMTRLYEYMERTHFMKDIQFQVKSHQGTEIDYKKQFNAIMKLFAVGQDSEKHMMPFGVVGYVNQKKEALIIQSNFTEDTNIQSTMDEDESFVEKSVQDIVKKARERGKSIASQEIELSRNEESLRFKPKFIPMKTSQTMKELRVDRTQDQIPKNLRYIHDKMNKQIHKVQQDPNIQRISKLIKKANLDISAIKLPQLQQNLSEHIGKESELL